MTKRELVTTVTTAEFWLALHARAALTAKNFARNGYRKGARSWGKSSRDYLTRYIIASK